MSSDVRIQIFDTTLRDGEQCPGAAMTGRQKLDVARQLARLGVDIIEAGFPIASRGDFDSVKEIARTVRGPVICGLARCINADIDAAGAAVKPAGKQGRIHVFLGTSKIHREFKLGKASDEILRLATEGVRRARKFTDNVEFSPEDASRTEIDFLVEVVEAAISAGATTINLPDTTGYATPEEYGRMFAEVIARVRGSAHAVFSTHCHNDLGLAVANSLAAVHAGARQVECTVNGIGERAGNAALEEIVMALHTRRDFYTHLTTGIHTREIVRTSRLVSGACGFPLPRNKAIVGLNAFAHSSGIHQDGILKKRETYEIMDPEEVGWGKTELPLTKHSGRAAVIARLKHLGYTLQPAELQAVFARFKEIGDRKKFVHDDDLVSLVGAQIHVAHETYSLENLTCRSGTNEKPLATVTLRHGRKKLAASGTGDGVVDAVMKTIDRITGLKGHLLDYAVRAVTEGKDAVGEVSLNVRFEAKGEPASGRAAATDVIESSGRAYLAAVNRWLAEGGRVSKKTRRTLASP
ncbi:MAG: 2-isopropylmalate synthase [Verrucomicrobia bacterium]|nr:2-isopropylmalate synthase [Verrucomicrobiota bacterium]